MTSPTRDTLSRNDSLPTFLSMEAEDVHQGNELLNYNQQISTESPDDEGGSYEYNETPAAAATAAAASSASSPLSNNAEDGQSSNDNDSENNVDAASSSRSTNSSARRHSRVNNCTICTIL